MTSVLSADSMLAAPAPLSTAPVSAPAPAPTTASPVPPLPTVSASSSPTTSAPPARSKPNKVHVPSACINCKKAHLACDISRPCKRCVSVGKDDTCRDVEHKKRGRPKLVDKQVEIDASAWGPQGKEPILSTKTRAKGKYTKSANYKASRRVVNATPSGAVSSGASMIGAAGPHNPIHTPSTATPSPDTTSSSASRSTVALQDAPATFSYMDRAQYARQDYHHHHHHPPPSYGASRPLDSPVREDKDPFYAQAHRHVPPSPQSPVVTLFLSMELYCARVSDESQTMWGFHPHEISNKSLHTIISAEDQAKLGRLQCLLKDALFAAANPADTRHLSQFPFIESTSPVFYQNRPGIMSSIAPGASEVTDVVRVRYANGGSDLFTIRLYIGGGLGTDLVRGAHVEHAYLVCVMTRYVDHHHVHHTPSHHHTAAHHHYPQPSSHHMTPRSSLEEPDRISPPSSANSSSCSLRTVSSSGSRPSSLYTDERPASYPTNGDVYNDSNGGSSRPSLPSLVNNVFTAPTSAPLPSPSSYSSRRDSMSLGSPLTPNPGTLPPTTSETSSSTLSHTSLSSTGSLHATSRPISSITSPYSSASLPPLRTEPLHKARWLYESEPLANARNTLHSHGHGSGDHASEAPTSYTNQHHHNHHNGGHGGSRASHHHHHGPAAGSRLPSLLSGSFGGFSAPMGGFGVSKYLNRPEPMSSFAPPTGRHMLSSSSTSSSSLPPLAGPTRSLQRDLSMSAYGASWGAQPPPAVSSALKRPMTDQLTTMTTRGLRQDEELDQVQEQRRRQQEEQLQQDEQEERGSRRQEEAQDEHHQQESSSSSSSSSSSPSPSPSSTTATSTTESTTTTTTTTSRSLALDLQAMPPDHPPVDMSKGSVCPIVHGERMKPPAATQPPTLVTPSMHAYSTTTTTTTTTATSAAHDASPTDTSPGPPPCPWAKEARTWSNPSKLHLEFDDQKHSSPLYHSQPPQQQHHHHHQYARPPPSPSPQDLGNHARNTTTSGNGHSTPYSGSPPPSPHHHPYRPTSSTYTYPSQSYHRRSSGSLSRHHHHHHHHHQGLKQQPCLSGACGLVCRCHVEDEETRAAKAMEAARKRMSVHSLLC